MKGTCKFRGCSFTLIGVLRVAHVGHPVSHSFGLCAVHREPVTLDAIESPLIGSLSWLPRSDWSDDGAAA